MMKRTLENLAQKRKDKEADFTASLEQLKTRIETYREGLNPQKLNQLISRLEEISTIQTEVPGKKRKSSRSRTDKKSSEEEDDEYTNLATERNKIDNKIGNIKNNLKKYNDELNSIKTDDVDDSKPKKKK